MEKKMALFDLDQQFHEIDILLESAGGDLEATANGKSLAEWLEKNEIATAQKIDGYCAVIEKILGDAQVCDQMMKRLKERKASMENKAERLKDALFQSMELRKILKVEAPMHTVWIQKNGGKPPVVIEKTLEEMPEKYRKTIPEHQEIDTEKLKADAIAGVKEALEICKVGEIGKSLRIK